MLYDSEVRAWRAMLLIMDEMPPAAAGAAWRQARTWAAHEARIWSNLIWSIARVRCPSRWRAVRTAFVTPTTSFPSTHRAWALRLSVLGRLGGDSRRGVGGLPGPPRWHLSASQPRPWAF